MERDHRRNRDTRTSVGDHKENKIAMVWSCQPLTGLAKLILQGSVEGRRSKGSLGTTWYDDIKSWTGRTSEEINRLSQDCRTWKKICSCFKYGDPMIVTVKGSLIGKV